MKRGIPRQAAGNKGREKTFAHESLNYKFQPILTAALKNLLEVFFGI